MVSLLQISLAKRGYQTKSFRGFYNDRICGTVFTDRCRNLTPKIICGSNYCAELAPYHAVLEMSSRSRVKSEREIRVVEEVNRPKEFSVKKKAGTA